jgi:DNA-binding transcriptional regulator GbsR (MarR family)
MRERPYTVGEIADMTGYSVQTVTRLFEREPGVLVIERKKKNGKRKSYRSIRIPVPVYERVLRKVARAA